jgi:hypothetical protein
MQPYFKAGDKTRTCDRLITNQLLYQLSYTSASAQISIANLYAIEPKTFPSLAQQIGRSHSPD